jgi:hypothetical protein
MTNPAGVAPGTYHVHAIGRISVSLTLSTVGDPFGPSFQADRTWRSDVDGVPVGSGRMMHVPPREVADWAGEVAGRIKGKVETLRIDVTFRWQGNRETLSVFREYVRPVPPSHIAVVAADAIARLGTTSEWS